MFEKNSYTCQPRGPNFDWFNKTFNNPILEGCFPRNVSLAGDPPGPMRFCITILILIGNVLVCLVACRFFTWAVSSGAGIWSREAQIKVHCFARAMRGINQAFLILVLIRPGGFHINPILLHIVLILITPAYMVGKSGDDPV